MARTETKRTKPEPMRAGRRYAITHQTLATGRSKPDTPYWTGWDSTRDVNTSARHSTISSSLRPSLRSLCSLRGHFSADAGAARMTARRPERGRPEKKTPRPKKKAANWGKPKKRTGSKHAQIRQRMDPSATANAETRFIQPYQATKTYLCPGCLRDIPPGLGHIVAVPPEDPDLRRHWHRGCWNNRHNL